jgi:hypothetical protein
MKNLFGGEMKISLNQADLRRILTAKPGFDKNFIKKLIDIHYLKKVLIVTKMVRFISWFSSLGCRDNWGR